MINQDVCQKSPVSFINFDKAVSMMKEEVDKALSSAPAIIREYTSHLSAVKGKFIRAVSILSCALDESDRIHPNAVKLAAAVEILHLATLVHDDIIDDADTRRGAITLQRKYGRKTAVICGDYLLSKALAMAASVTDGEQYLSFTLPDYMGRICFGELRQHINNGNLDLTVYNYFKIISGKTAALFEASFYVGAVLAEVEQAQFKRYKRLGHYIGMIFQLMDDCLDFVATKEVAKKPVQSDYEQKVITLPLIHAFQNKQSLKERAKTDNLTRDEINEAVEKSGGIAFTQMISKKYYDKAHQIINGLNVSNFKREKLAAILNQSYRILS